MHFSGKPLSGAATIPVLTPTEILAEQNWHTISFRYNHNTMKTTTLQVPLSKKLRDEAKKQAKAQGFSSLQEFVRIMLTMLKNQSLNISINQTQPDPWKQPLTPQQEAKLDKLIKKAEADYKAGKLHSFTNAEDMMTFLESRW